MKGKGTAVEFVAFLTGRKQWGRKKNGFNKHSRRSIHALDHDFV